MSFLNLMRTAILFLTVRVSISYIVFDRQDKSNCLLTLASLVILQSALLTSAFT